MSQEKSVAPDTSSPTLPTIPENLPEEMLPLYDWWKANGKQFVITLAVAVILVGGGFVFKHYRASEIAGANQELLKASSLDELENVVAKYGATKAGNAARLRLAKAYYDASKYEEALSAYETCLRKGAPQGFAEIAELGRAHALEGLSRTDEALTTYQAFEKTHADHFLQPHATLGIVRILTMQGKKDEAKKLLENLKAKKTGTPSWEMAIANLEGVVNRYEARAARSLFDAADAAAAKTDAPAALPVPVKDAPAAAPATATAK